MKCCLGTYALNIKLCKVEPDASKQVLIRPSASVLLTVCTHVTRIKLTHLLEYSHT